MKQRERSQRSVVQSIGIPFRSTGTSGTPLVQVSPVPSSRDEVLSLAMHFARRFAVTAGKDVPEFSEDAARFLSSRRWTLSDLTYRVCRAVEENSGALITAVDLGEPS
ncbi:MAG TPA: hypothetical protein VMT89_01280 [Candidatus Acidoferrales bacterium]|nr:hypothetical protein [Candidatus Acidoferrales bacterium]